MEIILIILFSILWSLIWWLLLPFHHHYTMGLWSNSLLEHNTVYKSAKFFIGSLLILHHMNAFNFKMYKIFLASGMPPEPLRGSKAHSSHCHTISCIAIFSVATFSANAGNSVTIMKAWRTMWWVGISVSCRVRVTVSVMISLRLIIGFDIFIFETCFLFQFLN